MPDHLLDEIGHWMFMAIITVAGLFYVGVLVYALLRAA